MGPKHWGMATYGAANDILSGDGPEWCWCGTTQLFTLFKSLSDPLGVSAVVCSCAFKMLKRPMAHKIPPSNGYLLLQYSNENVFGKPEISLGKYPGGERSEGAKPPF